MGAEFKPRNFESPSSLTTFMDCPRRYYFDYLSGMRSQSADYPRICGTAIHSAVRQLYKDTKDGRPYYYKSKKAFEGAFKHLWFSDLATRKENDTLIGQDRARESEYTGIGLHCIQQYWDKNVASGLPRPELVEERLEVFLPKSETPLVVVLDQVRQAPIEWIAKRRPELVVDGELDPAYSPHVIVDLKSGRESYEPWHFEENPDLTAMAAQQFSLHHSLQATAYTLAFEQKYGKKPVGFWLYHLRSGKGFFTYRDSGHIQDFEAVAQHVKLCVAASSLPKNVAAHCRHCDYFEPCSAAQVEGSGVRPLLVVRGDPKPPGDTVTDEKPVGIIRLSPGVVFDKHKQTRLKLKGVVRRAKSKPEIVTGPPVIWQLPTFELPDLEVLEPVDEDE